MVRGLRDLWVLWVVMGEKIWRSTLDGYGCLLHKKVCAMGIMPVHFKVFHQVFLRKKPECFRCWSEKAL